MFHFPLIRHVLHWKRRLQKIFVAARTSMRSRCLGTICRHRLIEGICEVRRWDELRYSDIPVHTLFHRHWFWHLKVVPGGGGSQTRHIDRVNIIIFENKESRLKLDIIETRRNCVEWIEPARDRVHKSRALNRRGTGPYRQPSASDGSFLDLFLDSCEWRRRVPRNAGLSPVYIAYNPEDRSFYCHRREHTRSDKVLKRYFIIQ
jgi:hypothetical protein